MNERLHRWTNLTLKVAERKQKQLLSASLESDSVDWIEEEREDSSPAETEPEYDKDGDNLSPSCGPAWPPTCRECYTSAEGSDRA